MKIGSDNKMWLLKFWKATREMHKFKILFTPADADLHPGNILVRVTDPNSLWGRVTNYFNIQTSPKLILLDVGMTAELLPEDQQSLIDLFRVCHSPLQFSALTATATGKDSIIPNRILKVPGKSWVDPIRKMQYYSGSILCTTSQARLQFVIFMFSFT